MRRLRPALLAVSFALSPLAAPATTATPVQFEQRMQPTPIADGVLAFIANESPGGLVQGNVTVFSGSRHSLVVDSGQYPLLAQRIAEEIRARGLPPVRYLVNTHWHGDHLLANAAFERAFPGLEIVQQRETARLAREKYADWTTQQLPRMRAAPARIEAALAKNRNVDGSPLDAEARAELMANAALARQWLPQADATGWIPPALVFDSQLDLDLGGRVVSLRHLGTANTAGDTVAWDATSRTLVTGDIVVAPTPYSFGSYHSEWIGVLDAMRALQPAQYVPGHGGVMRDDAYLRQLQALLVDTRAAVREHVAQGHDLDRIRAQVTLAEHERRFAGDDANRVRAFRRYYLTPGLEQAYKEAKGEPRTE